MSTPMTLIFDSPEWRAWVRDNEIYGEWNTSECEETGYINPEHFQEFIRFAAYQYAMSMALKYKQNTNLTHTQFAALLAQF